MKYKTFTTVIRTTTIPIVENHKDVFEMIRSDKFRCTGKKLTWGDFMFVDWRCLGLVSSMPTPFLVESP